MTEGFIHMGETFRAMNGTYGVACRCGWRSNDFVSRFLARQAGDKHLAEANA